jgi:hypothetical protein
MQRQFKCPGSRVGVCVLAARGQGGGQSRVCLCSTRHLHSLSCCTNPCLHTGTLRIQGETAQGGSWTLLRQQVSVLICPTATFNMLFLVASSLLLGPVQLWPRAFIHIHFYSSCNNYDTGPGGLLMHATMLFPTAVILIS